MINFLQPYKVLFRYLIACFFIVLCTTPSSSYSQEYLEQVIDRLNAIEKDLRDVQRQTYRDDRNGITPNIIESNQVDNSVVANHEKRLIDLEENIRNINGITEEISHKLEVIYKRLDEMANRMDQSETNLLENEAILQPEDSALINSVENKNNNIELIDETNTRKNVDLENTKKNKIVITDPNIEQNPSMKVLGTIKEEESLSTSNQDIESDNEYTDDSNLKNKDSEITNLEEEKPVSVARNQEPIEPSTTYQIAYDMLARADYASAENAFKAFIGEHPNHALTSNAYYWLGETYYVRKKYQLAAISFARGYQNFPKGAKAPDQLLKLGMTFVNLGKNDDACATFSQLETEFPKTPGRISKRAMEYSQHAKCS